MVKTEPEFETVANGGNSVICVAAELFIPDAGEPVLSVLPSLDPETLTPDETGFRRAAELSVSYMESRGFDPDPDFFDMTEFVSSAVTPRPLEKSGAEIKTDDGTEPFAEVSVGGVPVSLASVNDLQDEEYKTEIYVETDEAYRSRGYGTLCVSALRDVLVKKGRTVKYVAETNNTPSLRVAEKAGFVRAGRRFSAVFFKS